MVPGGEKRRRRPEKVRAERRQLKEGGDYKTIHLFSMCSKVTQGEGGFVFKGHPREGGVMCSKVTQGKGGHVFKGHPREGGSCVQRSPKGRGVMCSKVTKGKGGYLESTGSNLKF